MEFGLHNGGEYGQNNCIDFVEISEIFATQAKFCVLERGLFDGVQYLTFLLPKSGLSAILLQVLLCERLCQILWPTMLTMLVG